MSKHASKLPNKSVKPVPMVRYYCGLAVITAIVLVLGFASMLDLYNVRDDVKLMQRMDAVSSKFTDYATSKNALPASMAEANVDPQDTEGVTVMPINASMYALCGTFNKKSRGYTRDYNYETTVLDEANKAGNSIAPGTPIANSMGRGHEAGYSCLTYEPYVLSAANRSQYLCGDVRLTNTKSMYKYGPFSVRAIDPANLVLTTGVPIYYVEKVNKAAKVFDQNCQPIELAAIQPDQYVYYYKQYGQSDISLIQVTADRN